MRRLLTVLVVLLGSHAAPGCKGAGRSDVDGGARFTPDAARFDGAAPDAVGPDAHVGLADAAHVDAGPDHDAGPPEDAGSGDTTFHPGPHANGLVIPTAGGPVLDHAQLVTVTFSDNSFAATLEAFGDWLVSSSYLSEVGRDYGFSSATHLARVELAGATPASTTDADIQALISTQVGTGALPAPATHPQLIYALYLAPGSMVSIPSIGTASCASGAFAYHGDGRIAGARYTYAVILGCPTIGLTGAEAYERSASHEIIEAMSDPYADAPAYQMTDRGDPAYVYGAENGDLCLGLIARDTTFVAQRIWSNSAAMSGAPPCVPVPSDDPWLGLTTDVRTQMIPAGATMTFTIHAWSNVMTDPWRVYALRSDGTFSPGLMLDHAMVGNGDTVTLTVVAPASAPHGAYSIIELDGTRADRSMHELGEYTQWMIGVTVP